tara:strand:- start:5292 stop:5975 length:684 start_codon:yes stop_codon:yes gene_type:complete
MLNQPTLILIGNTRWHIAKKGEDKWSFSHLLPNENILSQLKGEIFWAAVGPVAESINLNKQCEIKVKDVPLINLPSWVGIDRALAGWEAFRKREESEKGVLVIDAGTIMSITKVSKNGEFMGGQLLGGLKLQMKSMHYGAKNLPLPEIKTDNLPQFPIDTSEAMYRGGLQALTGTIVEALESTQLPLWICGGDAPEILKELKLKHVKINHSPNLALEGMIHLYGRLN